MSTPSPTPGAQAQRRESAKTTIPMNLWIAIGALIAVTIFVIVSLFFGDVPAKGGKVTVTVLYFAVFVGITIAELSVADRDRYYPVPLAIVSSVYVVAYGVVLTWIEPIRVVGDSIYRGTSAGQNAGLAIGLLLPLVIAAKAPVAAARLTFKQAGDNAVLRFLAFASAGLFSLLAVILFLPTLLERSFRTDVGDWFGRLIVIVLMLAFLAISVFILLAWTFNADERRARRERRQQQLAGARQRQAHQTQVPQNQAVPYPTWASTPAQESPVVVSTVSGQPSSLHTSAGGASTNSETTDQHSERENGRGEVADPESLVPPRPSPAEGSAVPVAEPLPWPVYEDGLTPLPVGVDGRPVFSVLQPSPGRTEPVSEGTPEADAAVERARRLSRDS